jgi:hypothetical protein
MRQRALDGADPSALFALLGTYLGDIAPDRLQMLKHKIKRFPGHAQPPCQCWNMRGAGRRIKRESSTWRRGDGEKKAGKAESPRRHEGTKKKAEKQGVQEVSNPSPLASPRLPASM